MLPPKASSSLYREPAFSDSAPSTAKSVTSEPVVDGGNVASKAPNPNNPVPEWGWGSTGVSGLYDGAGKMSASKRQSEVNRKLLFEGGAHLTPEQEEKRLALLHAQSCIEN
jgi:hypothetical protein